jgi:hypothetical protein
VNVKTRDAEVKMMLQYEGVCIACDERADSAPLDEENRTRALPAQKEIDRTRCWGQPGASPTPRVKTVMPFPSKAGDAGCRHYQ